MIWLSTKYGTVRDLHVWHMLAAASLLALGLTVAVEMNELVPNLLCVLCMCTSRDMRVPVIRSQWMLHVSVCMQCWAEAVGVNILGGG